MEQHAVFTHQALDRSRSQIRLISVIPEAEGPVRCTIRLVDLDANPTPDYRALSYTWGPPSPKHRIYVNGKPLVVRLNLYDFLLAFRKRLHRFRGGGSYEEELQWLWIDQICIDQSVVEERNHQVQMMSSIYKRATYVYIWLGPSDERIETAMQTLKSGFRQYHDYRYTLAAKRIRGSGIRKESSKERAQKRKAHAVETLEGLFQNPYWERLWIVQEVMLARYIRIICGDTLLSWEELRRFCVSGLGNLISNTTLDVPNQVTWLCEHALSANTYSDLDLLRTFSGSQCHDPRDKVYGLQGLLVQTDQTPIDYAKSVVDVFDDASCALTQGARVIVLTPYTTILESLDYCKSVSEIFSAARHVLMQEQEARIQLRIIQTLLDLHQQMGLSSSKNSRVQAAKLVEEIGDLWTHLALVFTRNYLRCHDPLQNRRYLTTEEANKRTTAHHMDVAEQKQVSRRLDELYRVLLAQLYRISEQVLRKCGPREAILYPEYTWRDNFEDPILLEDVRAHASVIPRTTTLHAFAAMEEVRKTAENMTKHITTNTWDLHLVISSGLRFENVVQDVVVKADTGNVTSIEYQVLPSWTYQHPNSNDAHITLKIQPLTPNLHIAHVQTVFRAFERGRGTLILSIATGAAPSPDETPRPWDLSFKFDQSAFRQAGKRAYGTCTTFTSTKPPAHARYQATPELALAQDPRVQAKVFSDLGGERLTPVKCAGRTLWRVMAVGYS